MIIYSHLGPHSGSNGEANIEDRIARPVHSQAPLHAFLALCHTGAKFSNRAMTSTLLVKQLLASNPAWKTQANRVRQFVFVPVSASTFSITSSFLGRENSAKVIVCVCVSKFILDRDHLRPRRSIHQVPHPKSVAHQLGPAIGQPVLMASRADPLAIRKHNMKHNISQSWQLKQ